MSQYRAERILRSCFFGIALGTLLLLGVAFFCLTEVQRTYPSLGKKEALIREAVPLDLAFHFENKPICLPKMNLEGDLRCCRNRSRPSFLAPSQDRLILYLKGARKELTLPCSVGLKYDKGLQFADTDESFWMELFPMQDKKVEVKICLLDADGIRKESRASLTVEEPPIKESSAFTEGSPFRILSEARFLGRDPLRMKYQKGSPPYRIEMKGSDGSRNLEVWEDSLLVWKEGKWCVANSLEERTYPILASVNAVSEKKIFFDGWSLDEYVQLSVSSSKPQPFKIKADEFLSVVRVRSDKQVSCMLEKQCFVLRVGDWVCKENQRWRVLRKKEQRDAYLQGAFSGELFIFEGIEMRGGQKSLIGQLTNAEHSQCVSVEMKVGSRGNNKQPTAVRKGK